MLAVAFSRPMARGRTLRCSALYCQLVFRLEQDPHTVRYRERLEELVGVGAILLLDRRVRHLWPGRHDVFHGDALRSISRFVSNRTKGTHQIRLGFAVADRRLGHGGGREQKLGGSGGASDYINQERSLNNDKRASISAINRVLPGNYVRGVVCKAVTLPCTKSN